MSVQYVNWGESIVKLSWTKSDTLPGGYPVTSVHGFCFSAGRVLLVDLWNRGWDIPGGHLDPDETPEACFQREVREEAFAEGPCRLLGYLTVDHRENPHWTADSGYPEVALQPFYRMDIANLSPFESNTESIRRKFIEVEELPSVLRDWHELYEKIVGCAIKNEGLL